jgi:hypothetical protein
MFQNFDRQGSKINVRFYFNWNEVTTASIAVNCAIVEVPISAIYSLLPIPRKSYYLIIILCIGVL